MSSFDDIYDRPDPRAYFTRLAPLEYRIPHHAQPVFRAAVADLARRRPGRPVTVVDLCCSYGINAALLNHDVTLDELYDRYTGPATAGLSRAELAASDREFYASRRRPEAVPVVGVDVSARAVAYAVDAGLLDAGFAENLEAAPAGPALAAALAPADLVTVTGGLSYIGPRTFDAVVAPSGGRVRVVAFAVRPVDYRPVAEALARHGLVTTASGRTYPQRRFTGPEERRVVLERVRAAGLDPAGREAEGHYHAALYVSRPSAEEAGEEGN
ncbi:hypothetical protein AC230_02915 [Streptomyces caatingaensis]|uniref:Methyltransferase type 12 n=2 Tax=Streptomyces caatingaensis TaxID=1678637 RepID=A0A0K9XLC9_9ACTN|nr:hypothetical protein AC230_02915 [Streptomyces caatingaensis]